jgi:glutamyl-tRNA synthetase
MYEAFDWEPPKYAHVGLLLDQDHQKLSKRNLDTDVSSFKNSLEILPEALTNFVALLGWSHNLGKDAMTLEQLIQHVSIASVDLVALY